MINFIRNDLNKSRGISNKYLICFISISYPPTKKPKISNGCQPDFNSWKLMRETWVINLRIDWNKNGYPKAEKAASKWGSVKFFTFFPTIFISLKTLRRGVNWFRIILTKTKQSLVIEIISPRCDIIILSI